MSRNANAMYSRSSWHAATDGWARSSSRRRSTAVRVRQGRRRLRLLHSIKPTLRGRCGGMFGPGEIASGGLLLDSFVISISGLTGRQVVNRTGLQGFYALTLHYAVPRPLGTTYAAVDDSNPDFF